jgi:hypothetical protein
LSRQFWDLLTNSAAPTDAYTHITYKEISERIGTNKIFLLFDFHFLTLWRVLLLLFTVSLFYFILNNSQRDWKQNIYTPVLLLLCCVFTLPRPNLTGSRPPNRIGAQ